jgi:hypothetical protein
MNNKVYMRAAAVMGDPSFTVLIEEAKKKAGQLSDMDLDFPSDLGCVASLCIAMNTDAPDFIPLTRQIEIDHHGNEFDLSEIQIQLLGIIETLWGIITHFFPINDYGLPSTELWAWLIRCVDEEQCPEPEQCAYPVFHPFDPDQLMLRAEVECLRGLLKRQGINPYEAMKASGFEDTLDKMFDLLVDQPRLFIEVLPGETFSKAANDIGSKVGRLQNLLFEELEQYEVPLRFKEDLRDFFFPRQFGGATLTEIAESLPGVYDKSNVSRGIKKITLKTGYQRPSPHPRGKARHQ